MVPEYRFDPDSAHKGQKAIFLALRHMNDWVERPLRRVNLPEMPPSVKGAVAEGLASAIAVMADARAAAGAVASTIHAKAQDLGVYDKAAELSKWWTAGDIAISVTGGDAFYKSFGGLDITDPNWNPAQGKFGGWQETNYSKEEQAAAWASFGLNFLGGPIIKGVAKGGKWALRGLRGQKAAKGSKTLEATRVANEARYAQQLSDAGVHRATMNRQFGPTRKGPLPEFVINKEGKRVQIAEGFRSSTYSQVVESTDTLLYRVHGPGGELGSWWTRTPPRGPLQARLDSAIRPEWGNPMTEITVVSVPKGNPFFEGAVAAQGSMVGGGTQVYIPHVPDAWKVALQNARPK